MLQYIYGEDTFGAKLHIDNIVGSNAVTWVDKQGLGDFPVRQWLDQAGSSLFGGVTIIARDPSTFLQDQQNDVLDGVDAFVASDAHVILWDRIKCDKRSKFFRTLRPHGQEFPAFDSETCVRWLMSEATNRGMRIDQRAAAAVVHTVGTDRWRLSSELDRLELLGVPVTVEHVQEHVLPTHIEAKIFTFLDVLVSGDQRQTMHLLEEFWQAGEKEFYILSMLAYQFKTILAVRQGQERGFSSDAVARQTGLKPYVVTKTWRIAQRITSTQCLQALSRIMATDFTIKQGTVDARTATIMLTLTLVRERSARPSLA